MFLVGGGILLHANHALTMLVEGWSLGFKPIEWVVPMAVGGVLGLIAGVVLVKVWDAMSALLPGQRAK
jgi:predicted DNA repair protein MutK